MARRVYGGTPSQKPVQKPIKQENTIVEDIQQSPVEVASNPKPVVSSSETSTLPKRTGKRVYGSKPASSAVKADVVKSKSQQKPKNISKEDDDDDYIEIPVKNKKPVNKKKKVLRILVPLFFLIIFVIGAVMAIKYKREEANVAEIWNGVRDVAYVDDKPDIDGGEAYSLDPIDREIDWDALFEINKDVKCWVYIPGTNIDYPVMQEQKLNEYFYLNHDIYKNYLTMGSILTPKEPDGFEDKDAKFMLFGHHMIGKQMFGHLTNYKSEDFYKEWPYIYIYYPDRTERWIIWSAFHTDYSDMIYDIPYEKGADDYEALLKHIESKKLYSTAAGSVNKNMNILTLSTCDNPGGGHNGRFVVNSILHKTKWLDEEAEEKHIEKEREEERIRQEELRKDYQNGDYYDQYEIEFNGN